MATQYTSLLGLALPVTGELSGTWGDTVNQQITSLLDSAIAGTTSITTDADVTLTTSTGATNESRQAIILWNPASGTVTRTVTAPAQSKIYTIINASGGTQSIVFKAVGQTGITIVKGESAVIAFNGTDFIKIGNVGGGSSFTDLLVTGTTTLSGLTASTALALDASKNVVSVTNTGTGNNVLSASPTLTGTLAAAAATFSGNVTLGDATTDTVTVNGYMGVGGAPNGAFGVYARGAAQSGVTQAAFYSAFTGSSAGTTYLGSLVSALTVPDTAYTVGQVFALRAQNVTKGASATITSQYGVYIDDQTQGTNNFGIASLVSSGTNKWNIYASGTAQNYFAGNVGIGTTAFANSTLRVSTTDGTYPLGVSGTTTGLRIVTSATDLRLDAVDNTLAASYEPLYLNGSIVKFGTSLTERMRLDSTGLGIGTSSPTNTLSVTGSANITGNVTLGDATTDTVTVNGYMGIGGAANNSIKLYILQQNAVSTGAYGIISQVDANSANTSLGVCYEARPNTAAASFTVANLYGFRVANSVKGAGSTISNLMGLQIQDLTEGSSNFGIQSLVSSGTNKWNIFASGTAANYFAGNVQFAAGSAAAPALTRFNDDNTGIFFPAADSIAFAEGGAESMRITSAGNVGVGTTAPSAKFVVSDAGAIGFEIAPNFTGGIVRQIAYDRGTAAFVPLRNQASQYEFYTNAGEKLRIDSAGNVGIGTTSPGSILEISETNRANSSNATNLQVFTSNTATQDIGGTIGMGGFFNGTTSKVIFGSIRGAKENTTANNFSGYLAFQTIAQGGGLTERARIDSSGNLGLGVTPSAWSLAGMTAMQVKNGSVYGYLNEVGVQANLYYSSGWKYIASAVATQYVQVSGAHQWFNAPSGTAGAAATLTQAMTLDASGRLIRGATAGVTSSGGAICGIETLAGDTTGSSIGQYAFATTNAAPFLEMGFSRNATVGSQTVVNSGDVLGAVRFSGSDGTNFVRAAQIIGVVDGTPGTNDMPGRLVFSTSADGSATPTERMRIDSSGNLLVGTTGLIGSGKVSIYYTSASNQGIALNEASGTSGAIAIRFYSASTQVGTITTTTSSTAYNTSSDYRLKNTIAPMTGALAKVALLKPCTYKWNADGSDGEGFIAHELAEVVPQCVTGEKDAVDAEGNPQYQGIDTSFLVATLTAAIQEQQAIIESLKARLDAANI